MTKVDAQTMEVAGRIRELREIVGYSAEEMARLTAVSPEEYRACENGEHDLTFAFLYRCAAAFNVDVTDIIQGSSPKLKGYSVTRFGQGQHIEEANGLVYYNMASAFRGRIAEPLYVTTVYSREAETSPIECTTHEGQECDLVITGTLKVQIGSHTEVLKPGDCIYYDSSTPHGMVAVGGEDCSFYAIVLSPLAHADSKEDLSPEAFIGAVHREKKEEENRLYRNFVKTTEDENGKPLAVEFIHPEKFNFAFDVVDALGRSQPDKLAMVHLDRDHNEQRLTFKDIKDASSQVANYFKAMGIQRGDRVMLVLKRHVEYWYAVIGLHKLGAVAIPATYQLQEHDYVYRFQAAGVKAIVCTADGDAAHQVDLAAAQCPELQLKFLVGGQREGWHDFRAEYGFYTRRFRREEDAPCGTDPMLMFFTSGTTGYPKSAVHNYQYPLGHFVTAKYWHCVETDGLHLTISDTGWAKSSWGKLYGAWLCESAIFVYDFDRFHADDILPLFKQYQITTFCAPPTMYRMLIKEDLSKYDLSSVHHATIAGEALNPEVFRQMEASTGLRVMEGFGQSETALVIGNLIGDTHKIGSMGKPVPTFNVDLVDPDGNPVDVGENGEIVIRTGDTVPCGLFTGYYRDEEKTKEVWHDGMYHTGDVAWRDEDGFYWYVGRVDDVIKSSGYRIGPFEIENVIMELPYVLECGVSAAPDEVRGQVVKASIVLVPGTEGTEELKKEIQNYVKAHTAPYKYPRIVVFRDELPKTTSGKIIRSQL